MQKKSPVPALVVGLVMFLVGLVMIMLEVTATEANVQGLTFVGFKPSWETFMQVPDLISGNLPNGLVLPVLIGWGVELTYLTFVIAYDLAHDAVAKANSSLVGWFKTGIGLCLIWDLYTNYTYAGSIGNTVGRAILAGLLCFFAIFFPLIGFRLLEHGVKGTWAAGQSAQQGKAMVPVQQPPPQKAHS